MVTAPRRCCKLKICQIRQMSDKTQGKRWYHNGANEMWSSKLLVGMKIYEACLSSKYGCARASVVSWHITTVKRLIILIWESDLMITRSTYKRGLKLCLLGHSRVPSRFSPPVLEESKWIHSLWFITIRDSALFDTSSVPKFSSVLD